MTTILVSFLLRSNLEWISILRVMLQTPIADHHSSRDKALDREDGSQLLAFSARNDAIVIKGVHDVATDTSTETRKLGGKLDAHLNLVTQLAANEKPASVAKVCGICSSNDHHTSVCPSSHKSGVDEHPKAYALFSATNDAIVIRGVHDVATDTSAETRKLEGKLNAIVNLVTQLAANQNLPLLQESAASVQSMTTILVSVLLCSNLEWMSILKLILQPPIADHLSSKDKALDREDGTQLLAVQFKK
ncbi:hypothetical protein Fmac_032810 [Flemingia macrophylla]|uniref:Uncharacterized protein n=1 Tax=Flemingia macrophylla TaxID=520843 RepID=A0ABD1L601_9FABA